MAGAKELKGRINSVKNTRKITRTMEMVSTAKSKRMVDRVNGAKPYSLKIEEMMANLSGLEGEIDSPFLRRIDLPHRVALVVVTANRGLCGGYNSNVLKLAKQRMSEHQKHNREVDLYVIGKKGVAFFKFLKIPVKKSFTHIDDYFSYEDSLELCNEFMGMFASEQVDLIEVVSTVYESSARQYPKVTRLLPGGVERTGENGSEQPKGANLIYEQPPAEILESLLPHLIRTNFYRLLLEAVTSEQIFRRIAMKAATDAASDMVKVLNRTYNRIRQASITQELSEIVAGADAIS